MNFEPPRYVGRKDLSPESSSPTNSEELGQDIHNRKWK